MNILSRKVLLEHLQADMLTVSGTEGGTIEIDGQQSIAKIEYKEGNTIAKLKATLSIGGEDNKEFRVEIVYRIIVEIEGEVTEQAIKDNYEELFKGVGRKVSYINSFITNELLNSPLVLPPSIIKERNKDK